MKLHPTIKKVLAVSEVVIKAVKSVEEKPKKQPKKGAK